MILNILIVYNIGIIIMTITMAINSKLRECMEKEEVLAFSIFIWPVTALSLLFVFVYIRLLRKYFIKG